MAKREQAREEAAFLRGDVGVDGAATEADDREQAQKEQDQAREQVLRGRTYLGRELLTWLLWRSESGEPVVEAGGEGVVPLFVGKVLLRGLAGDVVELAAKGDAAAYSKQVRHALGGGLLVHQARIRFTMGERAFEVKLEPRSVSAQAVLGKVPEAALAPTAELLGLEGEEVGRGEA